MLSQHRVTGQVHSERVGEEVLGKKVRLKVKMGRKPGTASRDNPPPSPDNLSPQPDNLSP